MRTGGNLMPEKMPVIFIGHGSPLNLVLDNDFTRSLASWGKRLPRPTAILVISAHWLTHGTFVSSSAAPLTIYDFYGFPPELYTVTYGAPGAPELAATVASLLTTTVGSDGERGLDHGAWSVLHHLFPAADIPVCQLSLDYTFNEREPKPLQFHYNLARELAALRRQGVLIIGSGNMVHNLAQIDWDIDATPFVWAVEMDQRMQQALVTGNHHELLHLPTMGANVRLAVPTLDHYLPLLYTLALQEEGEPLAFTFAGIQNGSISMRSLQIG
jgi:4,5-DOPA dioxygenase extradiol